MRLFLAIRMEDDMRQALLRCQEEMRRQGVGGHYTKAENLHLTLLFIGEYPDTEAVGEIAAAVPFPPLSLRLKGIGAFGDLWWAGIEPNEALERAAARLRHALAEAGIPFDRKAFQTHITLVRRAVFPGPGLPDIAVPPAGMRADHFSLMRSDRGKDGWVYTEVLRFPGDAP